MGNVSWYAAAQKCFLAIGIDEANPAIGNWLPPNCSFECSVIERSPGDEPQNVLECVQQGSKQTSLLRDADKSQKVSNRSLLQKNNNSWFITEMADALKAGAKASKKPLKGIVGWYWNNR